MSGNNLLGTILALGAVNMAEIAGNTVSIENMAEMYVLFALQVKTSFPPALHWLGRYYLGRARGLINQSGTHAPVQLQWLSTPHGHRYFVIHKWNFGRSQSVFSSQSHSSKFVPSQGGNDLTIFFKRDVR